MIPRLEGPSRPAPRGRHRRRGGLPAGARLQRGVTLIVALIMLTALGLIAASALRSGTANMRIVDNTRARQQAFAAAQSAIEATISDSQFVSSPATVAAQPVSVDLDGDGTPDLSARIDPQPSCYRWRTIKVVELDPATSGDRACMGSSGANQSGIEGGASAATGDSLCASSEWNVRAVVSDPATSAVVRVNQGVGVRTLVTEVATACP